MIFAEMCTTEPPHENENEEQFFHEDIQREKRRRAWEEEALRQIEAGNCLSLFSITHIISSQTH
jgi:hypothetical protein